MFRGAVRTQDGILFTGSLAGVIACASVGGSERGQPSGREAKSKQQDAKSLGDGDNGYSDRRASGGSCAALRRVSCCQARN